MSDIAASSNGRSRYKSQFDLVGGADAYLQGSGRAALYITIYCIKKVCERLMTNN